MRYTIETEEQHRKVSTACVLYLTRDGKVPVSPMRWYAGGKLRVFFDHEIFEIGQKIREDLLSRNAIGLWPLLSLTKDGIVRELVEETCEQLHAIGEFELEFLTICLAELAFRSYSKEEYDWLIRRKQQMFESLPESTFMRELVEKGIAEGMAKGIEKGRKEGLEKGIEKGRKEGIEKELKSLRSILVGVVEARMPEWRDLARHQAALIDKPQVLHALTLNLAKAQTSEEVQRYLLHWQKVSRKRQIHTEL